jgi:hypothetical protein
VTELEEIRRRRELLVLTAELQRATVVRRLERIQANPTRSALAFAARAVKTPALMTLGTAALKVVWRKYRGKNSARKKH